MGLQCGPRGEITIKLTGRNVWLGLTSIGLSLLAGSPVRATGHTWDVNEVFSNFDGTIQFVELRNATTLAGETNLFNVPVTSNTRTFRFPGNLPFDSTGQRASGRNAQLLLGTQRYADLAALQGAPAPDYIICLPTAPAGQCTSPPFLFITGDTITYSLYDSFSFTLGQLPTDGVNSRSRSGATFVDGVNSPTNFSDVTGSLTMLPPGPPAVPDGGALTTPMSVVSNNAAATSLTISWDYFSCTNATNHQIIYGQGSQLPGGPGGLFAQVDIDGDLVNDPLGSVCSIGVNSPFTWLNVPAATDGTGLIWWLVMVSDGTTEGSWGLDRHRVAGPYGGSVPIDVERLGPGTNGSSTQCGVVDKDARNTCGQ